LRWPGGSVGLWIRRSTVGLAIPVAYLMGMLAPLERWGYDLQFQLRGPRPPEFPIVLVAIDEDSFDELDLPWPWPRDVHARFLDRVAAAGPAVIGLDIVFAEPSARGPEDDRVLADAIGRAGRVVLAAALTVVQEAGYQKVDLNPPIPPLRERAAGFGPVNIVPDPDAVVREVRLRHMHQSRDFPSFTLEVYRVAKQAGLAVGPFDAAALRVNYRGGPRTFLTIPYHRVVNGDVPPETFAGKIVLVGATSLVLHDLYRTPFALRGDMPGVEIHANTLETMFRGIPIRKVPRLAIVGLALAAGALAIWTAQRLPAPRALAVVLLAGAAYGGVSLAAFAWAHVSSDVGAVSAALLLAFGASVVEAVIREQRERRRLARFFSPGVVGEVIRQRDSGGLECARRTITVLFSDIRGFTSISEKMSPEEVAAFLREYLTTMTEIVFKHGGTVDKYMGDGLMALFNVPLEQPDHAERAVRAALEFQERLSALSGRFRAKYGADLRCGIGINTGEAVVGIIGSEQRLEYTAIGDAVNLGSRLESLTKEVKASIVISESTWREVRGRFATRALGEVAVRGKAHPVPIHAVLEADGRRFPRVPTQATITVADWSLGLFAPVCDLSPGGVSVEKVPVTLVPRQEVEVRLEVPGLSRRISARSRVVWTTNGRAGLHFEDLPPDDRAAIEAVLAHAGGTPRTEVPA
jgi:adenylate cyclase